MNRIKRLFPNIIVAIVLTVGIGLLAYPTISDRVNELHSSRAIGSYVKKTKDLSEDEKKGLLKEARKYNEDLVENSNRYHLDKEEKSRYSHMLDATDTGIMAYIEIPKLKVYMPIYHGVDEGTLQVAAGHIPGSSLPVGGPSTHSLISGHRGLPSAKLFTDLDQLKYGDIFFVYVFDEVLAYRINQIRTVLPDEVETLDIEQGRDYVTLITCTPYGVNSHRLLVRGERTRYVKPRQKVEDVIRKTTVKFILILVAIILTTLLILVYLIKRRRRRKYNEKH